MKKFLCILFMVFYPLLASAASDDSIRQRAFNAPDNISDNMKKLTAYLVKPYNNDFDKMKVIAYWIASHIAYDNYKFDNSVNLAAMEYHYDILKAKTGICTDFSRLFTEMSHLAGVKNVRTVTGYVVNTPRIRKTYPKKMQGVGHAWNEAVYNKKRFYIDTTWMSRSNIGKDGRKYKSNLRHKLDIKHRERKAEVNRAINSFFFAFTPSTEVEKYGTHHWQTQD